MSEKNQDAEVEESYLEIPEDLFEALIDRLATLADYTNHVFHFFYLITEVIPLLRGVKDHEPRFKLPEDEGFVFVFDGREYRDPIEIFYLWQFLFRWSQIKPSEETIRNSFLALQALAQYDAWLKRILARDAPELMKVVAAEEEKRKEKKPLDIAALYEMAEKAGEEEG